MTARGAAHFLRETVGRVRYGGASGQLTVGFYTHALVAVCREMGVASPSPSASTPADSTPDWTPIPYWMDGAADVETTYTPFLLIDPAITASSPTGTGKPWNWRPGPRRPRCGRRAAATPSPSGASAGPRCPRCTTNPVAVKCLVGAIPKARPEAPRPRRLHRQPARPACRRSLPASPGRSPLPR